MRVLITTDAVGGVWTYTMTLAGALTAAGDACFVAILGEPGADHRASLPAGVAWEAARHRLEWMEATESDIRAGSDWLVELERNWSPDIVHLNQFAYGAARFDAPSVVVAHSDVHSWFREVQEREATPEWAPYRSWVRAGLDGATATVAPSGYQSGMLARHYGRAADRVIPNGVAPPANGIGARASERRLVMTAGRAWDEAKGVAVLDSALALLGTRAPAAVVAGGLDGPGGVVYEPVRLRAPGRLGPDAMARLYGESAVYVATSLYEPFGLAPLEAAFHGCALVLSDIGSFRELWQDVAVFVPPRSPTALAAALADLLDDPERLDALAGAAAARARERYTAERMAERYRRLYTGIGADRGLEAAL